MSNRYPYRISPSNALMAFESAARHSSFTLAARELARIEANLNQIAHGANTFKANAEALEVVAHLVTIERAGAALAPVGSPDPDTH